MIELLYVKFTVLFHVSLVMVVLSLFPLKEAMKK